MRRWLTRRVALTAAVVVAVVAIGGGAAVAFAGGGGTLHATAFFDKTIGLYQGNDVRILGVKVGNVTKITPEGDRVRVEMAVDDKYKVPADAGAVIIPPSIVSDRYVELTPVYRGGPRLADHAVIPESRTRTPLELDEIFGNLDELNRALGPNGANAHGALSTLTDVSAANLGNGNGDRLHDALSAFSRAIQTLSDNRGDLFGTLTNLQRFTTNLAEHDSSVRQVNDDLAQVATILDDNRGELDAALRNLAVALGQVGQFVRGNRAALTTDVSQLAAVTNVLVKEKRALTEVLDDAPLGLQNLTLAYNPTYHTLDSRGDQQNSTSPTNPTNPACQLFTAITKQPCPKLPGAQQPTLSPSQEIMSLLGAGL